MRYTNFFTAWALIGAFFCVPVSADYIYSGSYPNVYTEFGRNYSMENLYGGLHELSESMFFDYSIITTDGSRVTLKDDSVVYVIDTNFIPMQHLTNASDGKYLDYAYGGILPLFNEEYYVKNFDGDKVYACRGERLDNVSDAGYLAGYHGYKFRALETIIACDELVCYLSGVKLGVEKPDQTTVEVEATVIANALVDDLDIKGLNVTEYPGLNAEIIVYNTSDCVVLEDDRKIEVAGRVKNNWLVNLGMVRQPFSPEMSIGWYDDASANKWLLSNITLTYQGSVTLASGESLPLPRGYKITSLGTTVYVDEMVSCTLAGDYPPCDDVTLSEVVGLINLWSSTNAELDEVVDLINKWAG